MSHLNYPASEDCDAAGTLERRAWVRYPSSQTTLCQETTAQNYDLWFMARICDISHSGVRLLLGHAFELGEEVAVEPIRTREPFKRSLQARVVYLNEEKRGTWLIGCEFTLPLTSEELDALTEDGPPSTTRA